MNQADWWNINCTPIHIHITVFTVTIGGADPCATYDVNEEGEQQRHADLQWQWKYSNNFDIEDTTKERSVKCCTRT